MSFISLETVFAVMTIYGSASYKTRQYYQFCGVVELAAAFKPSLYRSLYGSVEGETPVFVLLSSSAIQKTRIPFIVKHLLPNSELVQLKCRNCFSAASVLLNTSSTVGQATHNANSLSNGEVTGETKVFSSAETNH